MEYTASEIINRDLALKTNYSTEISIDKKYAKPSCTSSTSNQVPNCSYINNCTVNDINCKNGYLFKNLIDPHPLYREFLVEDGLKCLAQNEKGINVLKDYIEFTYSAAGYELSGSRPLNLLIRNMNLNTITFGIGRIIDDGSLGHYFAFILFPKTEKIALSHYHYYHHISRYRTIIIYDPMTSDKYTTTGYNAFLGVKQQILEKLSETNCRLIIKDLSSLCFLKNGTMKRRCIQHYFNANACHIYSLYFLFMSLKWFTSNNIDENKIRWDVIVNDTHIINIANLDTIARDHDNRCLKFAKIT